MMGQSTPHWGQTMSGRCGSCNANTTTADPSDLCSIDAETFPSDDHLIPQNLEEVLLVDNTRGSDHQEDDGTQEEAPENGSHGCSEEQSTRQPCKRDDVRKDGALANSAID